MTLRKRMPLLAAPVLLALAAAVLPGTAGPADALTLLPGQDVTTSNGKVRGSVHLDRREFLGIPFAAPPTGSGRFAAPRAVASWTGVKVTQKEASPCPQRSPVGPFGSSSQNEDCLYLNVYTPPLARSKNLPVMVWIHGGGYLVGATSEYDPRPLVTQGNVIVVEVAYRLNVFGFLTVGGLKGNYGLMDQQAGLRWVRKNIAAFGGDPANVTLFGESAGGNSVCQQLASPAAAGLFDKAIVESGACGSPTLEAQSPAAAVAAGTTYADEVGCTNPATRVACLRSLPVATLLKPKSTGFNSLGVQFAPTVDGTVLRGTSLKEFQAGRFHRVPVMIGGNHDEGRLFVSLFFHLRYLTPVTEKRYATAVRELFGTTRGNALLAAYASTRYGGSPSLALSALYTDGLFSCAALRSTQALAAGGQPVWAYELNEPKSPLTWTDPYMDLNSYHGAEMFYLFRTVIKIPAVLTPRQKTLSTQMIGYWSTFARTGNPNGGTRPLWYPANFGAIHTLKVAGSGSVPLSDALTDHRCGLW